MSNRTHHGLLVLINATAAACWCVGLVVLGIWAPTILKPILFLGALVGVACFVQLAEWHRELMRGE